MARTFKPSIFMITVLAAMLVGCNKPATTSGAGSNAATSNSDANRAAPVSAESVSGAQSNSNSQGEKPADKPAPPKAGADPVKMIGRYEMVQVQSGGVVSMISERKVEISFLADGTYSRTSKDKARSKAIHDDQGQYRIENGDQLVLTIQVSKKTIHNPPIEKRHKIMLSQDGEELQMISDKGDIAVFRKVR